jgi:hypothetical protein
MPKPTFPSVSVIKRQRLMDMQVLAWDRKQKTTETDGNVGFGMGQETENDRD